MPVKQPQFDLPRGLRGGSDLWDTKAAGVLLADDVFSSPPPPAFTLQPTNQSASVGGTATFTAAVSGSGVTFQWQRLAAA